MKKTVFLFLMMLMSTVWWQSNAQTYCASSGNSTTFENISNVTYAGINNTTTTHAGYNDFTAQVASVDAGGTNQISVTLNADGSDYVYAFFDWNQNGTLDDAGEVYTVVSSTSSDGPHTLSVGVPADAVEGNTRMRVLVGWNMSTPNPCGSFSYGEVEDYTVNVTIPTCPAPLDLMADAIAATTADVSWTAGDSETAWNVSWGAPGYTPGVDDLGTDTASTTSYQLAGLTPQTSYDVYVQADCGSSVLSNWAGPLSFTTACGTITEMFEDFDSYDIGSIVPDCWERIVPATSAGSQTITSTSPASGSRNIYQYASSTSNSVIVALPEFSNVNAGTHWLRLKARVSSGAPGTLSVGYVTDVSDHSSFVLIEDISITNTSYTSDGSEYTVGIPTSVPANARLAIKNANDGKHYYWDDVSWEQVPSCFEPSSLEVTGLTSTTADVAWVANNSETSWNVSWGAPGFDPDVDFLDTDTATTTSFQITGLSPNSDYEFYVQAHCGLGDESLWAGPVSFTTQCSSTSVPYVLDFENATTPNLPTCTSIETINGTPWKTSLSASGFTGKVLNYSYHPSGSGLADSWFYTQGIQLVAGTTYQISYKYGNNGTFYTESMKVAYGTSPISTAMTNSLADYPAIATTTPIDELITFTVAANGIYYFGFNSYSIAYQNQLYVDDITIDEAPPCPNSTGLIATNVGTTDAYLDWDVTITAGEWDIFVVEHDANNPTIPDNTTTPTYADVLSHPFHATGLSPSTTYDFYVRADCDMYVADWAGPYTFTTSCLTVSDFYEDFEATTGTDLPNCWSKVGTTGIVDTRADTKLSGSRVLYVYNNVTVALPTVDNASAGTHQMAMDVIGNISPGATIEFGYLTNATDASSFISISSIVTNSTAVAQEFVTIPVGMPTGDVVFAIYAPGATSSLIDNVRWEPIPSCLAPTALSATGITLTSVDISWTAGASETNWNISWGTPGYIPGDTDEIGTASASMTSYQISGLAPQTTYDVYVQADCGGGNESTWTGPMTFNTLVENDNLCNALPLTLGASSAGDAYTTVGATAEPGEPNGSCWSGTSSLQPLQSVWFSFVAPTSGNVTATTDILGGTLTDTHIAIYEAPTDCTDLSTLGTEVGCDEDGGIIVGYGWTSIATMTGLTPGDTYYIQVDGYGSSTGTFGIEVHDDGLDGFVYENGSWTPNDPSGNSTPSDNIYVIDGLTTINVPLEVKDIHVMSGATLRIENVLTLHGDMTIDGDLVFGSSFSGNGELAGVPTTSTITGEVTVEHYMQDRRSYRMVASSVTTTTSIHDNWQEGAMSRSDNPNPGYGTHITGSTIDQSKGFDATDTGNASMFEVDIPNQSFVAIDNTDATTLAAGHPYLLYVRGDRTLTNITTPDGHTATTLRARGQLVTGNHTQTFPTTVANQFVMFGNPYQSAVDINDVFANSTNVNTNQYYVYDVNIGDYGNYVTVMLPSGTNPSGSSANQYLQAGQAAQFATLSNGSTALNFMESAKAPGNYTSNNAGVNGLMSGDILNIQLYTAKNFSEGGSVHDGMAILFDAQYSNGITATDAPKAFGFGENIARDHNGTYLSIERREMPVAGEVYSLYTAGYNHQEYVFKIDLEGVTDVMLYLDDNYTGTSTLLQAGVNTYSFEVSDALSQASDRFSIRTESLLNVDDPTSFAGVRLYPNPLNAETFYVHAPMLNGKEVEIRIADISGRQIYNRTLQSTSDRIEVSVNDTLSSGVYLVTIKHAGEFKTYRLIRE